MIKQRRSYGALSVARLKAMLTKAEEALHREERKLAIEERKAAENKRKLDEIFRLSDEANEIKKIAYERLSSLRKVFVNKELPPMSKEENLRLVHIQSSIRSLRLDSKHDRLHVDGSRRTELLERIAALQKALDKGERADIARQKTRALAAAYEGKTRKTGRGVRNKLKSQLEIFPNCPYCCGQLGNKPHCDHIHPVALGGLSTPANMVYICASCNSNKKDLTLREFIEKMGFDRQRIERALISLGKRI